MSKDLWTWCVILTVVFARTILNKWAKLCIESKEQGATFYSGQVLQRCSESIHHYGSFEWLGTFGLQDADESMKVDVQEASVSVRVYHMLEVLHDGPPPLGYVSRKGQIELKPSISVMNCVQYLIEVTQGTVMFQ